jgi:hypothetical protein
MSCKSSSKDYIMERFVQRDSLFHPIITIFSWEPFIGLCFYTAQIVLRQY